ncbi:MAG: vWA domain-containing protein [Deltaproteobacteria bacterium]
MFEKGIAERVILFARFLRSHGFKVFSTGITDALKGVQETGLQSREDFFNILRANLVTGDMEWKIFKDLFEEFWRGQEMPEDKGREDQEEESVPNPEDLIMVAPPQRSTEDRVELLGPGKKESIEGTLYSPVALYERRDLSQFERGDIQVAHLILKSIMSSFRVADSRRFERSKKARDMDFRLILKRSLKVEGLPVELFYRRRKRRLKKLVILADVSGSMDRYVRFLMPFLLGLRGIGSQSEVYVFSTCLSRITFLVRKLPVEKALSRIACEVPDWSGGTRIGESLQQFHKCYGKKHLNKRTVVLIMSDGWDLGARSLLQREMQTLSGKVHSVIWLNPLAGDPEYRPLCRGMQAVLPYVDHLLAADSLQSLRRAGRVLGRVMCGT